MNNNDFGAKPRTIAFLAKTISDTVGSQLWKGITSRSAEIGYQVRTYTGTSLGVGSAARLFDFCSAEGIDAVLSWASSAEKPELSYFTRFQARPIYTFSTRFAGLETLQIDNRPGVREAVEHLIKVHGCKRIAFIQGPDNFQYFQERREAWQETLQQYGLYDPQLLSPHPTSVKNWGADMMSRFVNERNLKPGKDIDAVVAYTDIVALDAMQWLSENGYKVPEDIALFGFNQSINARNSVPSLATIGLPFLQQGREAVDLLHKIFQGDVSAKPSVLCSYMVTGQSCGCQSALVSDAAPQSGKAESIDVKKKKQHAKKIVDCTPPEILPLFDSIRSQVTSELLFGMSEDEKLYISPSVAIFLDAMISGLHASDSAPFVATFTNVLSAEFRNRGLFDVWHRIISYARTSLMSKIDPETPRFIIGGFLQQARLMVAEASERFVLFQMQNETSRADTIRKASNQIVSSFDIAAFASIMPSILQSLHIPFCAIVRPDGKGYASSFFACHEGSVLSVQESQWPVGELLPPSLIRRTASLPLIIEPLVFGKNFLGIVVFGQESDDPTIYQTLAEQLSIFMHGALLMEEQSAMRDRLAGTLQTLETRTSSVSIATKDVNQSIQGISTTMEEVAASIREISRNLGNVSGVVREAVLTGTGARTGMEELTIQTGRIGSVIDIINELAEQTNILALNAAIQASHAGEKGRAFSVVAREIKELARKTVDSTKTISETISLARDSTQKANDAIVSLLSIIQDISMLSIESEGAIKQQAAASNDISSLLTAAAHGSTGIAHALEQLSLLAKTES